MDELYMIIIRTIFFYFYIIVIFRLMGKREFAQLSLTDLIVFILIAEIIAIGIEKVNKNILISVIPITILVVLQIIFSYIGLKFPKLNDIIDGKPALIIDNGKIVLKNLLKNRFSISDISAELRTNNIKSIEDVSYAVLENDGGLSVFKKNDIENDYPFPLISDGIVDKEVLFKINKDMDWVYNILDNEEILLKNVFYAFYKKDKLYIIKREI